MAKGLSFAKKALERRAAEKLGKKVEEDFYDPYAVREPEPQAEPQSKIIRPTRDDIAKISRPPQEKTGVFDYDYKMPVRSSGVQRYQPKFGVSKRAQDLLLRQDVYDKMVGGVEAGMDVKDWYEAGPMYKSFVDEFGADEGNRRFDAFIDAVASTSPRSDVGTNVRNASYYYGQANPDRPPGSNQPPASFSDLPAKAPYPYGHLAQNLHRMNSEKTLYPGGTGFDERKNPKPLSFAWNFKGDPNLVTVDTHAFRAPAMLGEDPNFLETRFVGNKGDEPRNILKEFEAGQHNMSDLSRRGSMWQSKPNENEYAAYEDYYRRIAQDLGITPAEAQAAGWVGHGQMTGLESAPKSFMDFVEERILKTARERGMDPADVWREAIRGVRPLTMNKQMDLMAVPGASATG